MTDINNPRVVSSLPMVLWKMLYCDKTTYCDILVR